LPLPPGAENPSYATVGRIAVLYVDAAYCYRQTEQRDSVGRSVAVSEPCKNGAEPIEMLFMILTQVGPSTMPK